VSGRGEGDLQCRTVLMRLGAGGRDRAVVGASGVTSISVSARVKSGAVVAPMLSFIADCFCGFGRSCNRAKSSASIDLCDFYKSAWSYWRLWPEARASEYMREVRRKRNHECCVAHFSFISTIFLVRTWDEERERWYALLIWFIDWPMRIRR